jgi:type I restriction-modification system DNA methylase subunit
MGLFQQSVLNKYVRDLDANVVSNAFKMFTNIFSDPIKQRNILNSKEEQYQEGFLRELFVDVLGFILNPNPNFNLITEKKNENNNKKADGAILDGLKVMAIIELKSTKTIDLGTIETQAFGYKNNQQGCKYVITSNFQKIRFYIENTINFEEFDLFNLSYDNFQILWVCLNKDSLMNDIPYQMRLLSNTAEENITKKLYSDYSNFRINLFSDIQAKNGLVDKLLLFKKTQKLLDRFLFLFFAEDKGLVSPNWTRKILNDWTDLKDKFDNYVPLYDRFRKNFEYLNSGFRSKDIDIFAYNGGLFAPDSLLDALIIDDQILYHGTIKLSNYDFDTEVDVNILGHIFEHSLNELEHIQDEGKSHQNERISKRKKDGVFYTPKYITKYIVENTLGAICNAQKEKIGILDEDFEFIPLKSSKILTKKREFQNNQLNQYREWLLKLRILDPSCGSGAFLTQALDFLTFEHRKIDELKASLLGGSIVLSDIENTILERNIYGVDINDEATEIARLSLWLRTARRGRKLNNLNNNIKTGNSLINDALIANEKAFIWQNEFREVFEQGGFDVIIGNPPYGAQVSEIEKRYFDVNYTITQYNYDTYSFFFELCMKHLLKPSGILGFITPNTFMVLENGEKLRKLLFMENTAITLVETLDAFSDAVVETMVSIFSRSIPSLDNRINILTKTKANIDLPIENYNQNFLALKDILSSNKLITNYRASTNSFSLRKKIFSNSVPLTSIAKIITGVKPYQVGKGTPKQTRDIVNQKSFTAFEKRSEKWLPVIRGTQVLRYKLLNNNEFIYYGVWLAEPRTIDIFRGEKLFIRRTDDKLLVAYDDQDSISINSAHVLKIKNTDEHDYKTLMALLNSKLMKWVFQFENFHMVNKPLAEIKVIFLERLPIKIPIGSKFLHQTSNDLISLFHELETVENSLNSVLSSKFEDPTWLKKFKNWTKLSDTTFLKYFESQQVTVSRQAEWLDFFRSQKTKALLLEERITTIQSQIDNVIYKLYNLNEEDIEMIESIY